MSVTFASPPAASVDALKQAFEEHAHAFASQAEAQGGGDFSEPEQRMPHPIYTSTLQDAAAGAAVRHAKIVAWRYVAGIGDNVRTAEVNIDPKGGGHSFASLNFGPHGASLLHALGGLGSSGEGAQDKDAEVRVLRLPALKVEALWLHSAGGADQIVPLAPSHFDSDPETSFTVPQFEAALVERAKSLLGGDSETGGG